MENIEVFHDHFQNWKRHIGCKAQLIIADPPYNLGKNAYASNPAWYVDGDNANGAPCMILFCEFEQQFKYIELGKKYGFNHYINLVFRKNFSAQVLKANMRVVGNCEYGLILYRDKLPKFNNDGRMIFNCFDWTRDNETPKVHPTQKPVPLLRQLIEIFTDPGDVVIDPCCGSGSTLRAAAEIGRRAYGFEIKKEFVNAARTQVLTNIQKSLFV